MDILEKVEQKVIEFLENLSIEAKISSEILSDSNDKKYISLSIEGDNLGELIGYHGAMLGSIQNVLSLMLRADLGEEYYLMVDINNYKADRAENIKQLTEKAINNVLENNQEIALSPMNGFERRIVHMTVQENDQVESESEGEGEERHVVIKPI